MDNTNKYKQQAEALPVQAVDAPVVAPSYPVGEPELPDHFSLLSAQHGPTHNDEAHKKLHGKLQEHGFSPIEIDGHYGHPEKSYLVPHDGSPQSQKTIEDLAFKDHSQESVLHSSRGQNELKMRDGTPSWRGEGHVHGQEFDSYYSVLPSGHKFRLNVAAPQEGVKKSDDEMELKKPHCYGKHDGVWVFHATHPSHNDSLVGDKYENLDDGGFKDAIAHAKKRGVGSIVLSGTPPGKLLTRIHPDLGPIEPGHISKSEEESAVAESKKNKSSARLVKTANLGTRLKELKNKVNSDLQSGKLKGKKVSMPVQEFVNEHTKLVDVLESPSHDDDKAEADKQAKELEQKLKEMEAKKDQPEVIHGKDLMAGLSNPEKECEACEQPVDHCICYVGLPKPRLEFDGKKVSIFFKSEWSLQDRENFVEDLKRRAGRILKKRYNK
jgi:hypothetical protein